jgi:uncharacterized phage protein (TIGR01671 family)
MREIKFRAWNENYKQMKKISGIDMGIKRVFLDDGLFSWWMFDHCEVMQYTGVHDQSEDEKEIYEGDIVKFTFESVKYIGTVKFEAGTFILAGHELPDSYIPFLEMIDSDRDYYWLDGEVIGNIYENLALLEG